MEVPYTSYYLDSSDRLLKVLTGVSCGGLSHTPYLAASRRERGPVSRRVATAILRNEVVSSRHLRRHVARVPSFVEDSGGCLDNCAGVFSSRCIRTHRT